MTTKHSPLRELKAQADRMAQVLKAAERGEKLSNVANAASFARDKPTVTFGIAMDDKFLTIEMPWLRVKETNEAALSEFIVKEMREKGDDA